MKRKTTTKSQKQVTFKSYDEAMEKLFPSVITVTRQEIEKKRKSEDVMKDLATSVLNRL